MCTEYYTDNWDVWYTGADVAFYYENHFNLAQCVLRNWSVTGTCD